MISARYAPVVAGLLALASIPTILHGYLSTAADDGRRVSALPMRLDRVYGRPSERGLSWVTEVFATTDFVERKYGPSLTLFAARSSDAKRLYHHPELAIAHGSSFQPAVVVRNPDRPTVPMFLLNGDAGGFCIYTLLYDDEVIEDPMRHQLREAIHLLYRPRKLTTLFFVRDTANTVSASVGQSPADQLLLAAVDSFLALRPAH